jgi:predicted metal-dependent phosphoesterase TrpH
MNKVKADLHLHTCVSDGVMTPDQILQRAKELGLKSISITDHDAVGAYIHFGKNIFKKANDLGITLIPGIELDSKYRGKEIHILGHEIDILYKPLRQYLDHTQEMRKKKVREQIQGINAHFKRDIINEKDIFLPFRDTLMKPHVVYPLLQHNLFSDYREAAKWLTTEIKTITNVPKPSAREIITLIKNAGGKAVLAHPGYYILENGLNIQEMIEDFLPIGLDGLEVFYPYVGTSRSFRDPRREEKIINLLSELAQTYHLLATCGSDAHELEQMRIYSMYI